MGEITIIVTNTQSPHDPDIYDYFYVLKEFVLTPAPQLLQDCMEQFRKQLIVGFETYLDRQILHQDQLVAAIGYKLERPLGRGE